MAIFLFEALLPPCSEISSQFFHNSLTFPCPTPHFSSPSASAQPQAFLNVPPYHCPPCLTLLIRNLADICYFSLCLCADVLTTLFRVPICSLCSRQCFPLHKWIVSLGGFTCIFTLNRPIQPHHFPTGSPHAFGSCCLPECPSLIPTHINHNSFFPLTFYPTNTCTNAHACIQTRLLSSTYTLSNRQVSGER